MLKKLSELSLSNHPSTTVGLQKTRYSDLTMLISPVDSDALPVHLEGTTSEPVGRSLNSYHSNSDDAMVTAMLLELEDGSLQQGYSFGAKRSVAGELVFQTGMVGYPESITDPSYRGQILVVTFPLVGNYGVPSRATRDAVIRSLPAYFEASQIHISGLVVASYSGEDYSHHLATSSLATWLKEQDIPATYGIDTRALTKRIREKGSMLGKLRLRSEEISNGTSNGHTGQTASLSTMLVPHDQAAFQDLDWINPNTKNLVADGEPLLLAVFSMCDALTFSNSIY